MVEAQEFVDAAEREVLRVVTGAHDFAADIEEPVPGVVTVVHVRFRIGPELVERSWILRNLVGVVRSEDPFVLARFVVDRMVSPVDVLTFDCDWGHSWPLWSSDDENPVPSASDIGLSDELGSHLRAFYDFWEQHYIFEEGWDDPSNQSRALDWAEVLTAALTVETAGRMVVDNGFRVTFG